MLCKEVAGGTLSGLLVSALLFTGCLSDFSATGDAVCGNGVLETGEVCDGTDFGTQDCQSAVGTLFGVLGCTEACQLVVSGCHNCGDGVIGDDEVCDDGNGVSGDGCAELCSVEEGWQCSGEPSMCQALCGDGLVRGEEGCDDGNLQDGDGCSPSCAVEGNWVCWGEPSECERACDPDCGPCDLDGDGWQRNDPASGCPESGYTLPDFDCNDFDAGVFPSITDNCGGDEGGHPACAAYRLCDGIDNDCDGEIDEGCPDPMCDLDNDGFLNNDPFCDPPVGAADCDDTDPSFYPGAPDICGDGILQNCNTDTPCDSDDDGDGYNADVDCDDTDPDVYPGAIEVCNGVDDDCDGLVDEGNPDASGTHMLDVYCNDDNDGVCGAPSGAGRCVCTAYLPSTARDPGNRVSCPGEDLGAAASPRCLFAPQPSTEQCDPLDWDCNGATDDPTGANLAELGEPCGTDQGECVAGQVVGCDHNQSTPGAFNPSFVCSTDFVGPVAELCNGLDDNCDGALPNDELDMDGDHYLACAGCGSGPFAPGIVGCGDCADANPARYPGAFEECNGINDDCNSGTPDGVDECVGATPNCCTTLQLCVNTDTDFNHCGSCTQACDSFRANLCTNGNCRCGTSPPCTSGQQCTGAGTCECNSASCPSGCCSGNTCVPYSSQSSSTCGDNGQSCSSCPFNRTCSSGQCLCFGSLNPPNESNCGDGVDNDCDGLTDCADANCEGDSCGPGMVCSGGSCI